MVSRFFNYALKNFQNGNINEATLDKYVTAGLITSDEKIQIVNTI